MYYNSISLVELNMVVNYHNDNEISKYILIEFEQKNKIIGVEKL